MLRNHGLLVCGTSIADAFVNMYTFENTCRIQLDAQAGGELITVDPRILDGVAQAVKTVTRGGAGALVWPALLRKLDKLDASYKD
jgi:ribulose-5-phosphate 4-epimerase/fuculose-1-phosphate aldolase